MKKSYTLLFTAMALMSFTMAAQSVPAWKTKDLRGGFPRRKPIRYGRN